MSSFQSLRAARDLRHENARGGRLAEQADIPRESDICPAKLPTPSSTPTPLTTLSPDGHLYGVGEYGLQVRHSPISGRGLYATKRISKGTKILTTPPRVAVLSTDKLQTHCSGCFQQKKVQRCAGCKALHYCSGVCQKSDWGVHKHECRALSRFRTLWAEAYPEKARRGTDNSWVLNEAVRALGRMCWARAERDPSWWALIAAMVPSASPDELQLAQQVRHLQHYLGAADPSKGADPALVHPANMGNYGFNSAREVMDMCSAFMNNSFTLTTPDMTPVGVATSPLCALFNHACAPNAVIVFPKAGSGMTVVAIADIAEGEQVLTSYLDVSQPYAERQVELRERYGFTCGCTLCLKEKEPGWVDPRWSVKHPGCVQGGTGRMPDLEGEDAEVRCSCGELFPVDVDSLRTLIERGKNLIAQDDAGTLDRETGTVALANTIASLAGIMPDSSHPLLQLLHAHAVLLLPPRNDEEKALGTTLLTRAIDGAKGGSYPPNHPSTALWMAERARLMALDVSPQSKPQEQISAQVRAIAALQDAATACDIAFGKGGTVAQQLMDEKAAAEQFISMASRFG